MIMAIINLIAYKFWIFCLCFAIILIFIYCFKLEKKLKLTLDFEKKFSNILFTIFMLAIPWINILMLSVLIIRITPSIFNNFIFKLKKIRG